MTAVVEARVTPSMATDQFVAEGSPVSANVTWNGGVGKVNRSLMGGLRVQLSFPRVPLGSPRSHSAVVSTEYVL